MRSLGVRKSAVKPPASCCRWTGSALLRTPRSLVRIMSVSATPAAPKTLRQFADDLTVAEAQLREGGGKAGLDRQHRLGRLFVRERLEHLLDPGTPFFELGLWAAFGMYKEFGKATAAGVVCGIGTIQGRQAMVIANDASVKAGAFFPMTAKKILRAQRIAFWCGLPIVYLVDSAGVFLPLQDEVFPDEDDFGRIFRNNAVFSAAGLPQIAAVMGNCVAGGAYLPVLCDKVLMTEGSELYLAGPALVKAAINQSVDAEALGGAAMHASLAGTIDFREKDDPACLARIRTLFDLQPTDSPPVLGSIEPEVNPNAVYEFVSPDGRKEYDARKLLACVVDAGSLNEYKADYGPTLVTAYAKIGGRPVGIVANQRMRCKTAGGELQLGGVIYADSAEKAARFIMDCTQTQIPLVFIQDVQGFMVGRDAEQSGIIRRGAKLVSAMSNASVPKITVIVGSSFGAGHYVMCGKAFDPTFILAWPNARYSVMGADQAASVLAQVQESTAKREGRVLSDEERWELKNTIRQSYLESMDIRYGAARGWVDAIIPPHETRLALIEALKCVSRPKPKPLVQTGVFQV
jgi:3-methylcrotonyl-CoA carboxylase beta subunit